MGDLHTLITTGGIAWSLILIASAIWFYLSFRETDQPHKKKSSR